MVLFAFRTRNRVVLHVILDYIVSSTDYNMAAAIHHSVVAAFQNLDFSLDNIVCIVPRAFDIIDVAVGQ